MSFQTFWIVFAAASLHSVPHWYALTVEFFQAGIRVRTGPRWWRLPLALVVGLVVMVAGWCLDIAPISLMEVVIPVFAYLTGMTWRGREVRWTPEVTDSANSQ